MPRYELTIKAAYLPGWDTYSGVRELIQNARDAEIQDGAPMKVEHVYRIRDKKPVGAIVITNEGTTMPKEAFLVGHTSKEKRSDLIGKFGEGFKFGILALLRQGLNIKIRNGDESWDPLIVRSEKYDAEVLAFDVRGGNKYEKRIQIEILGIELDAWEQMKKKFLFLIPPPASTTIPVPSGKILCDANYKGNLYVKGMFVCFDAGFNFGYDIDDADIDRDRRMVNDRTSLTSKLLAEAFQNGNLTDAVYDLLKLRDEQVANVYGYTLGDSGCERIAALFQKEYGEDALPCEDEKQVVELSHFGKRGVKVSWNLRDILERKLGNARENLKKIRMGVRHTYAIDDLSVSEIEYLQTAIDYLRPALRKCGMDTSVCERIRVVDFGDAKLLGTFHEEDNSIRLARSTLRSIPRALRVLIHETGHVSGPDGTKEHEEAIGNLTEAVFDNLPTV